MIAFLTDTERQIRPPTFQQHFRFWLDFEYKGTTFRRWFASAGDVDRYRAELPSCGIVVSGQGEQQW